MRFHLIQVDRLPIGQALRNAIVRKCLSVLQTGKPFMLRQRQQIGNHNRNFDVQFTAISRNEANVDGVLVMFGPGGTESPEKEGGIAKAAKKAKTNAKPGNSGRKR